MRTFTSLDGLRILVGENAKDNDQLTESSYPDEWWLHVSGVPGSHVVVAFDGDLLPKETKRDAAVLATHYSKVPTTAKMSVVDLCRVRDLGMGKASGQVYLDGDVCQLHIFMQREKDRLERLFKK